MTDHSFFAPSAAKRWMNCPGSVRLCAGLPPSPPSEYSAEGTVAHDLASKIIAGKLSVSALMDMVGLKVQQDGFSISVTDEMVDAVVEYNDVIRGEREALRILGKPAQVKEIIEAKVEIADLGKGVVFGRVDCAFYQNGNKIVVVDFKYGKGVPVEVDGNPQMMCYLLGVMDMAGTRAFDERELLVVQPRAPHFMGSVRRWSPGRGEVDKFRENIKNAVVAAQAAEAPLSAGEWCRWCPAAASCPEMFRKVQAEAGADFAVIPSQSPALPLAAHVPVDRIAAALRWEDAINAWYEALKLRAKQMLESGGAVPGLKLVEGKSNRKWALPEEEVGARLVDMGLRPERVWEKSLISPAGAEKLVGKKGLPADLWEKPPGKRAVALEDDPRPAVKPSAQEDFAPANALAKLDEVLDGAASAKKEPIWP